MSVNREPARRLAERATVVDMECYAIAVAARAFGGRRSWAR